MPWIEIPAMSVQRSGKIPIQARRVVLDERPERHLPQGKAAEAEREGAGAGLADLLGQRRRRDPESVEGRPRESDGRAAFVLEAGVDDERLPLALVERARGEDEVTRREREGDLDSAFDGDDSSGGEGRGGHAGSRAWRGTGAETPSRSRGAPGP